MTTVIGRSSVTKDVFKVVKEWMARMPAPNNEDPYYGGGYDFIGDMIPGGSAEAGGRTPSGSQEANQSGFSPSQEAHMNQFASEDAMGVAAFMSMGLPPFKAFHEYVMSQGGLENVLKNARPPPQDFTSWEDYGSRSGEFNEAGGDHSYGASGTLVDPRAVINGMQAFVDKARKLSSSDLQAKIEECKKIEDHQSVLNWLKPERSDLFHIAAEYEDFDAMTQFYAEARKNCESFYTNVRDKKHTGFSVDSYDKPHLVGTPLKASGGKQTPEVNGPFGATNIPPLSMPPSRPTKSIRPTKKTMDTSSTFDAASSSEEEKKPTKKSGSGSPRSGKGQGK